MQLPCTLISSVNLWPWKEIAAHGWWLPAGADYVRTVFSSPP
ncbi:hypothetical protein MUK42_13532 [Musa troglodytarum]|uniref:Uncharacterized protein n=1 Tax=Musa troglodytarum TaxID=320322 RepID=A0A9E7H2Y4_9LILI|nr:hypothetical protein MUK42_13532 [Musa troglodytarum]